MYQMHRCSMLMNAIANFLNIQVMNGLIYVVLLIFIPHIDSWLNSYPYRKRYIYLITITLSSLYLILLLVMSPSLIPYWLPVSLYFFISLIIFIAPPRKLRAYKITRAILFTANIIFITYLEYFLLIKY